MHVCVRASVFAEKKTRGEKVPINSQKPFIFSVCCVFPHLDVFFILLGYNEYCFMRIEKLFKLLVNLANCHVLFVFCLLLSLDDASLLGDPVFCSTSCTQDEFTGYAYNIITHKLSTSMKWTRTPIMNCVTFFFAHSSDRIIIAFFCVSWMIRRIRLFEKGEHICAAQSRIHFKTHFERKKIG